MKMRNGFCAISIFPVLAGLLLSFSAEAGTRTVYFDQSAVASSINGFKTDQYAKCRIAVSNPSNYSQDIKITIYPISILGGNTAVMGTKSTTANIPTGFTGGSSTSDPFVSPTAPVTTLSAGQSATYDFLFGKFDMNLGTTDQQLSCRGNIQATDTTSTLPGFVVASGMILTFSEASASQTMGSTSNTTAYVGSAVYTQIPMSINGGKPF